jgi:hypothetical protein
MREILFGSYFMAYGAAAPWGFGGHFLRNCFAPVRLHYLQDVSLKCVGTVLWATPWPRLVGLVARSNDEYSFHPNH